MGCGSSSTAVVVSAEADNSVNDEGYNSKSTTESGEKALAPLPDTKAKSLQTNCEVTIQGDHALPILEGTDLSSRNSRMPPGSPFNIKRSIESLQRNRCIPDNGKETETDIKDATAEFQNSANSRSDSVKEESSSAIGDKNETNYVQESVQTSVPFLTGQVTSDVSEVVKRNKTFRVNLRRACKLSQNQRLIETASSSNTLKLDHSFNSFTKSNLLSKVVATMKCLHTLDLSSGQIGPIAFRFIVTALKHESTIKNINLSDNLANPECAASIGSLLASNSSLEVLNVSGNRLGKEALSRHVGSSLSGNATLKSLDISNCGATDLHCLWESIRNSACSCLSTLNVADNSIADDHQFVVDISLNLENENCKLKDLDISNTSIGPNAMNILIDAISKNVSVTSMRLGKNSMENVEKLCLMILNICAHRNMTLFSMGKTSIAASTPCDFSKFDICFEKALKNSQITYMDVADCSLDHDTLQYLARMINGKLPNLEFLDVSKNDIGPDGLRVLNKFCNCNVRQLKMTQMQQTNGIIDVIKSECVKVSHLDFTRSKLSQDDVRDLISYSMTHANSLHVGGMKLSGFEPLSGLDDIRTIATITEMNLSVCQLNDDDMSPLCTFLAQAAHSSLRKIDLSVNRLTAKFILNIVESILKHHHHTLEALNVSNNVIDGSSLESLIRLFTTSTHVTSVSRVDISYNDITASYVTNFLSVFLNQMFPLQFFDVSNQSESFVESDMEDMAKVLKDVFLSQQIMKSEVDFVIDLRGNGGSEISDFGLIDSASIKTDFTSRRRPEPTLRDLVELTIGLYSRSADVEVDTFSIPVQLWKDVILKDAPAWALVSSELKKAALLTHMPSSVTCQRITGMLEMEADCDVKDLFIVKDPIMQQSTGAAWVLFENASSLEQAVNMFYDGFAYIFGGQFSICELPLSISDESEDALVIAREDLDNRNLEAQEQNRRDQQMLEESVQLAAERAEYRELHPAYQGGRIS